MVEDVAKGRQVLVVEDELTIVLVIEDALCKLGAAIVGPEASLEEALLLARGARIDAAILDINIQGGSSYPVADILASRGIPFVLCSGYSEWAVEERHRDRPRLSKPYSSKELSAVVARLLATASG